MKTTGGKSVKFGQKLEEILENLESWQNAFGLLQYCCTYLQHLVFSVSFVSSVGVVFPILFQIGLFCSWCPIGASR